MSKEINWDFWGMAASIGCAIHCAILPVILTSLPLFGINIIDNIYFEAGMIGLACIIGLIALQKGKKHHGSNVPMYIFICGMFFLISKEIFHDWHIVLLIPAVVFILAAHIYNYKLCAKTSFHKANKKLATK